MMRKLDRFRGCLIGGAAGDALGYAVEFLGENQIFKKYGSTGITAYALRNGAAEISDDTQMTLFTASGLLSGAANGAESCLCSVQRMYQCWYRTQTESYPLRDQNTDTWLLTVPELFSCRAPGTTCMSAIEQGANGSVTEPINNSKGCGGVMRVAPIGLFFCDKPVSYAETDLLGAQAAALTHGHELGYIPAAALVHIVRTVAEKDLPLKNAVEEAVAAMNDLFPQVRFIADFSAIMKKAIRLSETEEDDLEAIHQLGEGWVGEEALAIAVYCALKYRNDFDMALRAAVNHNGDSDSTGAVTGNILGAALGYQAIPQKYKERLELHDVVMKAAEELYHG